MYAWGNLLALRSFDGGSSVPAISHHSSRASNHMGITILHTYIHTHIIENTHEYIHTYIQIKQTSPSYAPTDGSFPNCCCCCCWSIFGAGQYLQRVRMYVCMYMRVWIRCHLQPQCGPHEQCAGAYLCRNLRCHPQTDPSSEISIIMEY